MLQSLGLLALLSLTVTVRADCAADNCLRALRATQIPGRLQSAQAFCATYTTATYTGAVGIPTYAVNNCKGDVASRVSSACSCIAPATTTSASVTTTPTGTPTSLQACGKVSSSSAAQAATSTGMHFHLTLRAVDIAE